MKKIIYLSLGMIGLALGAIGAAVPLLPSFPFLLLAAFGFAKSSEKLDTWFKSTKLYKNNLETYINGEGMTKQTKIKVMSLVSLLLGFGFFMMGAVPVGRIIIVFVWLFHMVYFIYGVKTVNKE